MKALVTGASRGIGKAIAQALLQAGYEVTGTSRDPAALPETDRLPGMRWLALDLRSGPGIDACAAAAGDVDVLVNNAGGSQIGPFEELPLDRIRSLFEMNLFGTIRLTQRILPRMRARRGGSIIAVASFAAVTPVPFLSSYAGSKAALTAMFRGLRHEAGPWGIRVSVVAPFDVHTTIPLDVGYDEHSAYLASILRVREHRDRQLATGPDPAVVAGVVLRVLRSRRPRFFYVAGRSARLTAFLVRHLPEGVAEAGVRKRFGLS
jgi:NAD(P)-dependent dehydrogenase (short-subunit alcohol dehydrogenase family)